MENKRNENYSHNDRNSQKNYEFQSNRDTNEAKNASDRKNAGASQRSPENGRDSNTPSSDSGSFNAINRNNEQGQKENYYAGNDDQITNADDFDGTDYDNIRD